MTLIERLEAATEGGRELDAEIAIAVRSDGCGIKTEKPGIVIDAGGEYATPHYTTSLDAALSLVPEGWRWEVTNNYIERGCPCYSPNDTISELGCTATVERPDTQSDPDADWFGPLVGGTAVRCATPALALCIAALKARTP